MDSYRHGCLHKRCSANIWLSCPARVMIKMTLFFCSVWHTHSCRTGSDHSRSEITRDSHLPSRRESETGTKVHYGRRATFCPACTVCVCVLARVLCLWSSNLASKDFSPPKQFILALVTFYCYLSSDIIFLLLLVWFIWPVKMGLRSVHLPHKVHPSVLL